MPATISLDAARRAALVALGTVCVALGVVGIFVPGLPTTVFLLLASYFFSRSSERLRGWLWGHRVLGPYLEMARDRRMPRRAKIVSVTSIWGGITCAVMSPAAAHPAILPLLIVAGSVGSAAILSLGGTPQGAS